MNSPLRITLGNLSAEDDRQFESHFIETIYHKRLLSNDSNIVYGTKGSGKTALRRALAEINSNYYLNTITIDLSSISFEAVHSRLASLKETIGIEISNLARTTWKNILVNYALLAFSETLNDFDVLKIEILNLLREDGFLHEDIEPNQATNLQMTNVIENLFLKFGKWPVENKKTLTGITPEQLNVANKFPLNEKSLHILKESVKKIEQKSKKILICLDGFDSIVDHTPASRQAIFAGLIDAIFKLRLDPLLCDAYCFKAFLPQELTLDAVSVAWDSDKHLQHIHYLKWTEEDFKFFIEKRLSNYSKVKSTKFIDVWNEFMPDKINNSVHSIEENSFEYIIRHTLYRPRQVLSHVQEIFDRWKEHSSHDRVDPSFIPQVIAKNNQLLADKVADQLKLFYPNVTSFLKSWQNSTTIINVKKFREKIKKFFSLNSFFEVDNIFDELFNFGIFGIVTKEVNYKDSKRLICRFAFVGDNLNSYIHNSIDEDDYIAIAPMFREYCSCHASNEGIIIPVSV